MKSFNINIKRLSSFMSIIFLALIITSCASGPPTIEFNVLEPAEINMSKYRNIAVPSTVSYKKWNYSYSNSYIPFRSGSFYDYNNFRLLPYSGYQTPLPDSLAAYTNEILVSALRRTNYFNTVIAGSAADNLYNIITIPGVSYGDVIEANNIDAFITSEVTKMNLNEYLDVEPVYEWETYKDKNGVEHRRRVVDYYIYTLYQRVTVGVTYNVVDARTRRVIASRTVEDSTSKTTTVYPYTIYAPSVLPYYKGLLNNLNSSVLRSLSPHKVSKVEQLMKNDPELEAYEDAWELAKNNYLVAARDRFYLAWKQEKHLPSGYNAAIIYYANGDYKSAISLLEEVYTYTHSGEAALKLSEVRALKESNDRAEAQLKQ